MFIYDTLYHIDIGLYCAVFYEVKRMVKDSTRFGSYLKKSISIIMSVILIMVLMPEKPFAEELRDIYLHVSLDDSPEVTVLGDFTAESLTTGDVYTFEYTGNYAPNNCMEFKIKVPVDVYYPRGLAALCLRHCSTCVAQDIRGMMI